MAKLHNWKANNKTNNNQSLEMFSDLVHGRIEQVRQKINHGADVNVRNLDGSHLLVYVLKYGTKELLKDMLNKNTIDVNALMVDNQHIIGELIKNDVGMINILEQHISSSNAQDLPTNAQLRASYTQAMQAGILWNEINNHILFQNIDLATLLSLVTAAGADILALSTNPNETENDTEDKVKAKNPNIITEEENMSQVTDTSLENKKLKDEMMNLILNHINLNCEIPNNNAAKIATLKHCMQHLESFLCNNMGHTKSVVSTEDNDLAFIYNPGLSSSKKY